MPQWRSAFPRTVARRAEACAQQDADQPLTFVGDEWSDRKSLEEVLDEYVFPFCPAGAVAAEIGCGGGRVLGVRLYKVLRDRLPTPPMGPLGPCGNGMSEGALACGRGAGVHRSAMARSCCSRDCG